jgi:hypothetical protein
MMREGSAVRLTGAHPKAARMLVRRHTDFGRPKWLSRDLQPRGSMVVAEHWKARER